MEKSKSNNIYCIHGVDKRAKNKSLLFNNILNLDMYVRYLNNRDEKFVSIEDTFRGLGDSLTIDDATEAGYFAAKEAIYAGHMVTLFINPSNVLNNTPYWFLELNKIIALSKKDKILFDKRCFDLTNEHGKKIFKNSVRKHVLDFQSDYNRLNELLKTLSEQLDYREDRNMSHFNTLTLERVIELKEMGVAIASHLWTHSFFSKLSFEEQYQEIIDANKWFLDLLGNQKKIIAVPWGQCLPQIHLLNSEHIDMWLLADNRFFGGRIGSKLFNRISLQL